MDPVGNDDGRAARPPARGLFAKIWGRPVGLLVLKDGSLLIADDGGKKIWRVSYRGR